MQHLRTLSPSFLPVLLLAAVALSAALPAPAADDAAIARIDINTATFEELQTLKGIGPALAGRIIQYRQDNGAFEKIEELMNIRGIGEKTFLRFRDRITVGKPADRKN